MRVTLAGAVVVLSIATAGTAAASIIDRPQAASLRLPNGHSTRSFAITAPSPPKHTWDVRIVTQSTADVSITARTWYGVSLYLLNSTRNRRACSTRPARTTCLLRYPHLEAQRAGRWRIVVRKRSQGPATVRVAITFYAH